MLTFLPSFIAFNYLVSIPFSSLHDRLLCHICNMRTSVVMQGKKMSSFPYSGIFLFSVLMCHSNNPIVHCHIVAVIVYTSSSSWSWRILFESLPNTENLSSRRLCFGWNEGGYFGSRCNFLHFQIFVWDFFFPWKSKRERQFFIP